MTTPPGARGMDFTHGNLEDQQTLLIQYPMADPKQYGPNLKRGRAVGESKAKSQSLVTARGESNSQPSGRLMSGINKKGDCVSKL